MKILLVYASYSTGTLTAAEYADGVLSQKGHHVKLMQAKDVDPQEFAEYELVILASPSWWVDNKDGQPHIFYKELFNKAENISFEGKHFAIFGLGDTSYAHFCGAVDVLETFVKDHNGTLMTESLRIDSFYFDQKTNEEKLSQWLQQLG